MVAWMMTMMIAMMVVIVTIMMVMGRVIIVCQFLFRFWRYVIS